MLLEDNVVVMGCAITAPGPFSEYHFFVFILLEPTLSTHASIYYFFTESSLASLAHRDSHLQLQRFYKDLPTTFFFIETNWLSTQVLDNTAMILFKDKKVVKVSAVAAPFPLSKNHLLIFIT
jgi:hypothetical protein